MKFFDYIKSLLPVLKRDELTEHMELAKNELTESTIPAYASCIKLLATWKFKNPAIVKLDSDFKNFIKGKGNMAVIIHDSFDQVVENFGVVERLVLDTVKSDIATQGMTYKTATLLQLVEQFGFVSKYARKLLIYIFQRETEEFVGEGSDYNKTLSQAEIEWLESNLSSFCIALKTLTNKIELKFNDIPDVQITRDNEHTLSATLGKDAVDPFMLGFIPVSMNPFYHVKMASLSAEVNEYKVAQEELRILQLKKLDLEKQSKGTPDAALQKEIDYLSRRISNINYKIAQIEAKVH